MTVLNNRDSEKKLLIIDGMNCIRKIYEAIPIEIEEIKVQATIKSTYLSITNAIKRDRPHYFLMAMDTRDKTFRHRLYDGYKSGRKPISPELTAGVEKIIADLNSIGLNSLTVPEMEAEDIIASLAPKSVSRGMPTIVLSNDKDVFCLLDRGVKIFNHFKNESIDEQYVQSKFNVHPRQMTDLLALMGDTTDGIPGIPKVGIATASKLLNQFDSLERIFEVAKTEPGKLPPKLLNTFLQFEDVAILSKNLALLKSDIDLKLTPANLKIPESLRVDLLEFDAKISINENNQIFAEIAKERQIKPSTM